RARLRRRPHRLFAAVGGKPPFWKSCQAERPAAGLNHGFLFSFPRFFLSFALHRWCIRDLHVEPIERSARNECAESFINTSLSKLEHNSNHRPAADAKSGSVETSAPSRDCIYWLARARQRVREYISLGPLPCDTLY